MNKHTPGPWGIGEEHESKVDIINKDGKTIATAKPAGGLWCDKEMKENAKLIAAAPEMYEILETIFYNGAHMSNQEWHKIYGLMLRLKEASND